jgi:hypothetical protein
LAGSDDALINKYTSWASDLSFFLGVRPGSPNLVVFRAGINAPIAIESNVASPISTDTWYHVAIVRISNVVKMFLDGVEQTETHSSGTHDLSNAGILRIGAVSGNGSTTPFNGNIEDMRITKAGRYTGNFTPTGPFDDTGIAVTLTPTPTATPTATVTPTPP